MQSVTAGPAGSRTVVLEAGSRAPKVGGALLVPVSAAAPQGLFGVVTAAVHRPDGSTALTTGPAALSDIYSMLEIQASGSLASVTATPLRAQGHIASLEPLRLSCSGAAPAPNLAVDLSGLNYTFTLDLPNDIGFQLSGTPQFTLGLSLPAQVSCSGQVIASIPLGKTGLFIEIGPQVSISAGGDVAASFTWAPRLTYGFYRTRSGAGDSDTHALTSGDNNFGFTGSGGISISLALRIAISAGGQAGVEGTLGPTLSAAVTHSTVTGQTCRSVDGSADADLDAYAKILFANWTFELAHVTFWQHHFSDTCTGGAANGTGAGTSSLSAPPSSATPTGPGTAPSPSGPAPLPPCTASAAVGGAVVAGLGTVVADDAGDLTAVANAPASAPAPCANVAYQPSTGTWSQPQLLSPDPAIVVASSRNGWTAALLSTGDDAMAMVERPPNGNWSAPTPVPFAAIGEYAIDATALGVDDVGAVDVADQVNGAPVSGNDFHFEDATYSPGAGWNVPVVVGTLPANAYPFSFFSLVDSDTGDVEVAWDVVTDSGGPGNCNVKPPYELYATSRRDGAWDSPVDLGHISECGSPTLTGDHSGNVALGYSTQTSYAFRDNAEQMPTVSYRSAGSAGWSAPVVFPGVGGVSVAMNSNGIAAALWGSAYNGALELSRASNGGPWNTTSLPVAATETFQGAPLALDDAGIASFVGGATVSTVLADSAYAVSGPLVRTGTSRAGLSGVSVTPGGKEDVWWTDCAGLHVTSFSDADLPTSFGSAAVCP